MSSEATVAGVHPSARAAAWTLMIAAAAILMITMGARQTLGLFLSPLNTATGLGIASISFALAVGQFMWGVAQPVFGAIADRYGPTRVIVAGGVHAGARHGADALHQQSNGR